MDGVTGASYCSVILERNTPVPAQAVKQYASVDKQQVKFKVTIVQGEDGQPLDDCLVVGERVIELPPRDNSKPSLEATMGYDASGMVDLNVHDLVSGKTEDIAIDFYARS